MAGLFSRSGFNFLVFGGLVITIIVGLYASAVATYVFFVWNYIPPAIIHVPVNFDYSSDITSSPIALFTLPELGLSKENYKVDLELDMPRTKANRELGNFMARFVFTDELPPYQDYNRWIRSSQLQFTKRTAILPYQSEPVQILDSILWAPLYAFGLKQESAQIQLQSVELDNTKKPRYVIVDLDKQVQLAGAKLTWRVQLVGLRYLITTYPIISFVTGTGFVFFIELVFALVAAIRYLAKHPGQQRPVRVKIPPEEMEAAIEDYFKRKMEKDQYNDVEIKQEPSSSYEDQSSDPTLRDISVYQGSPKLRPKFQCSASPATSACVDSPQGQLTSEKASKSLRK